MVVEISGRDTIHVYLHRIGVKIGVISQRYGVASKIKQWLINEK